MPSFVIRQHQVRDKRRAYSVVTLVNERLENAGFINGFSTRIGGVSRLPSSALNLSDKKDSRKNVLENTTRFLGSLGLTKTPLVMGHQTHSDQSLIINRSHTKIRKTLYADAFIAKDPGFLIGVKIADCTPILLADPKTGVVAAVHAGWRGTLQRIVQKTIRHMQKTGNVRPGDLLAVVGPAACVGCYEVGMDVVDQFKSEFKAWRGLFEKNKRTKKFHLNNAKANFEQLKEMKVNPANILTAPFCTMHHNNLFFSHRKESRGGRVSVGRQVAVIGKIK